MFFILSKVLLFLLNPIIWIFSLLLSGILAKNAIRKKRLLWASIIIFYFFTNSFIADEFIRIYEERNQTYSELTDFYDVAIVLGGFSDYDPTQELVQFHSSTDRLMAGLKLYKTGRAKKIMIVSGSGHLTQPDAKEALFIKDYLLSIGVSPKDLIIESESKNTRENAVNTAKILNELYTDGNYLLVTSATHMPRAKKCFKKVGLFVTPFSVDQQAGPRKYLFDHLFFPNADNLKKWQTLFKEWAGFIAYKASGYI
ncbi:MAG: YdcF family protein [Flavobacteriales bacterium]|nr:YdcF family protein [Flavobacteriales bacterium]